MLFLELRGNNGGENNEDDIEDARQTGGTRRRGSARDEGLANDDTTNNKSNSSTNGVEKDSVDSERIHGNGIDGDNGSDPVGCRPTATSDPPVLQLLLHEIEDVCAERRTRLRQQQHLDVRRRASTAVEALHAARAPLSTTSARGATAAPRQTRSTPSGSGSFDAGRHCYQKPGAQGEAAVRTVAWSSGDGGRIDGRRRGRTAGIEGDSSGGGSDSGGSGNGNSLRRPPGSENSAAKPRPLEGALPLRGYYLSPLLDSSFDLLMLREPACAPADLSLYVNRARHMLEQRRALREEQRGGGNRCGGGGKRGNSGGGGGGGVGDGRTRDGKSRGGGAAVGLRGGVDDVRNGGISDSLDGDRGGRKGKGGSCPALAASRTASERGAVGSQASTVAGKKSPVGPFKKGTVGE